MIFLGTNGNFLGKNPVGSHKKYNVRTYNAFDRQLVGLVGVGGASHILNGEGAKHTFENPPTQLRVGICQLNTIFDYIFRRGWGGTVPLASNRGGRSSERNSLVLLQFIQNIVKNTFYFVISVWNMYLFE